MNQPPGPASSPAELLAGQASAAPQSVFASVEDADGSIQLITYAEALDRARQVAGALAAAGVRRGSFVHLHMDNRYDFFDYWFATNLLGGAIVPTNPLLTAPELEHVLTDCHPVLSVTTRALLPTVTASAAPGHPVVTAEDRARSTGHPTVTFEPDVDRSQQVAAVLYTSGTTSRPKGVLISNRNYVEVGAAVARHLSVSQADRWLVALPLFHANAQYYCAMSALTAGGSIALTPRFSASRWAQQARRHRATLASLFAAPIRMILASAAADGDAINDLRAVVFAQSVTDEQAETFETRFATRLLQLYGMTETVIPPTMNPDSARRLWHSIGQPLAGVSVALRDADGNTPADGDIGELTITGQRGRTIALGYLNNEDATTATFGDGVLRTGDLATRDADGFYTFVDRSKDMIKRAGENVAASEVETVLDAHPNVRESAAVGVPDPIRDQAIVVFVVTDGPPPSHESLTEWCRQRLASFKVPSVFVCVDTLPRNSIGKLDRQQLRVTAARDHAPATDRDSVETTRG